jgi:hypothetical protein
MQYLDRAKEIMDEFQKISGLPIELDLDLDLACFEINPPQDRMSGRRFWLVAGDFDRYGTIQFKIKCVLGTIDDSKACVDLTFINGNCGYFGGLFACAMHSDPSIPPTFVLAERIVFTPSTSSKEAASILWSELIDIIGKRYEVPRGVFLF